MEKMNKNIQDYVKVYKNLLESDTCDLTVNHLETCEFEKHKFYNVNSGQFVYNEIEPSTHMGIVPLHDNIMQANRTAIIRYLTELNFKWCTSWEGFRSPKFNRYMPDTKMAEHCDHIHDLFDGNRKGIPILSIVGLLNNNFQGGDFVMFQDEKYKLTKGDIIIFPANFLYPHLVDTVTSGVRYSYASWVW
jgi:hypothetical protein